jgi:hypothetical protein
MSQEPFISRRTALKTMALSCTAISCGAGVSPAAAQARQAPPWFLTRGMIFVVKDLQTVDWPRRVKAAGLTTISTHIFPHEIAAFLKTEAGQAFWEGCRRYGIQVEHALHAASDLLPRALFDKDPAMFPMNEKGERVRNYNLCVHSPRALEIACENAVKYSHLVPSTSGRYFYYTDDNAPLCRCRKCRGLSDCDQALILENRLVAALRRENPRAMLVHSVYNRFLSPPAQVKPGPGIFMEFAPIARKYDRSIGDRQPRPGEDPRHGPLLDLLDANLAVFGREGAQVADYWLDASLPVRWQRDKIRKVTLNREIFRADLRTYAQRGIRHITGCSTWLDGDYLKRFGEPPVNEYGQDMLRWKLVDGRAVER